MAYMKIADEQPALPALPQTTTSMASFARVVTLCSAVAFLDGFDTQAIGPAASSIAAELGVPTSALGAVFSTSQIGFLLGALLFGPLGDRYGRKRALSGAIGIFALATLATAFSSSYLLLLTYRVLAGFGLGGATPNFVSLAAEYSPPRLRARVVTMMWAAVPLGGTTAAFAGAAIIPTFGWKTIFILGSIAPLLLMPVLLARLPDSTETSPEMTETRAAASSPSSLAHNVAVLFAPGRVGTTLLLWVVSFMTWMTLVVVAFWTPSLLQRAGLSGAAAASTLALNNAGGVAGILMVGVALKRFAPQQALPFLYLGAAVFIAAMGITLSSFALLACIAVVAGVCSSAAGGAFLALSANVYPADIRSTGVGWALGFGRIGSIVGPLAASVLVAREWDVARIYLAMSCPALVAAAAMLLLAPRVASNEPHP
jgi:MFS transporter, AAHS family, 4-hydroxybenzoate transporter